MNDKDKPFFIKLILIVVILISFSAVLIVTRYLINYKSTINPKVPVSSQDKPEWIKQLIVQEESGEVANPPASLSKCIYKGSVVYYLPQRCCDVPSVLYNEQGKQVCSPDGGSTGKGDFRCNDFLKEKKNCEIIWQDSRLYGWQTYRNEKYGFEVKYPQDFEGQEPETGDILLEATKKDSGGSYYFTIKTRANYKIDRDASIVANSEKIIVGGHQGYKYFYTEGAGKSGVVLIQAGQDELTVSFDFIGDGQIANDRKIYFQDFFDQILSTFKFINQ